MTRLVAVAGTAQMFGTSAKIRAALSKMDSNFVELYDTVLISFPVPAHASKTIYNVFIADQTYTVRSIRYVPDVAQGAALTATAVKATGTATPAAGTTPLHSANAINCNATAHTVQTIALTGVSADLNLAAGDRIGLVLSGALSTGSGTLGIRLRKA